jgi:hypothetical protein
MDKGLRMRVYVLGYMVKGVGYRIHIFGFRVQDFSGLGSRIYSLGLGLRV